MDVKYNYENYTLVLVWKNLLSCERIPIGELCKDKNLFKFKYIDKDDSKRGDVKLAMDQGFIPFGTLKDVSKEYTSEELFDPFLSRLPVKFRDKNVFKSLRRTGGKLPIDNLEFMKWSDLDREKATLKINVSGFKYIVNESILSDLFENQEVILEFDSENEYDSNAIKIMTKESKTKLGYVPEKYKDYIDNLVKKQDYHAEIEQIENDKLFLNISGEMISNIVSEGKQLSDKFNKLNEYNKRSESNKLMKVSKINFNDNMSVNSSDNFANDTDLKLGAA